MSPAELGMLSAGLEGRLAAAVVCCLLAYLIVRRRKRQWPHLFWGLFGIWGVLGVAIFLKKRAESTAATEPAAPR